MPVLRRLNAHSELALHLIVTGAHLSPEFGLTIEAIEPEFEIGERIEMLLSSDTPEGLSKSLGLGVIGFAESFSRKRPDILLVLGDRFEMHAAVLAALPFKIPVAHIHGGELTEGAIDDALRHSITKMSHLHFVATDAYKERVIRMGEEPWRVALTGSPALDNLRILDFLSREELERRYGLRLSEPFLLVTYHPATLEHEQTEAQVKELLRALDEGAMATVFTYPGADTASRRIIRMIEDHTARNKAAQIVVNLGTQGYFSMMRQAAAMVGNSSSGIVEAPSFKLPVVNIGNRQRGRVRAKNVIDVGYGQEEIQSGIRRALQPEFRASLADLVNPYGDGHASEKIVERLRAVKIDDALLVKRFYEI